MNFNLMTTSPTKLACLCLLTLGQALPAAPAQGYVVEWGYDTPAGVATTPKLVLSNAVAVALGMFHGLALRRDGTVAGWRGNFSGQATGAELSERAVGPATVRIGGRVLTNVIAIAAGRQFSLALETDGTLATWGQNYIPKELTNALAIAAAGYSSAVLKADGTLVEWFSDPSLHQYGELFPAVGVSNAIAIALGQAYIGVRRVALLSAGTVTSWGQPGTDYAEAMPPPGLSNVVQVAASGGHTLALKSDGTVIGWGYNKNGQATGAPTPELPCISAGQVRLEGHTLTNIVSVAAAEGYSLAVSRDGRLVAWGRMVNDLYPAIVPPGLSNVVAVAAGWDTCLAITVEGQLHPARQ